MALHYLQTKVNPLGKDETSPALTITPSLRKGQKNNPLKNMDIPMELRAPLRKGNSRQLAHAMQIAGGPMSTNGRRYAAVLEERGVNPNVATTNVPLAKQLPNDIYKRASYHRMGNLIKLADSLDITAGDVGSTALGGAVGYGAQRLVSRFAPGFAPGAMKFLPAVGALAGFGINRYRQPSQPQDTTQPQAPMGDRLASTGAGAVTGSALGTAAGLASGGIGNRLKGAAIGGAFGGLLGAGIGWNAGGKPQQPQQVQQPQQINPGVSYGTQQ